MFSLASVLNSVDSTQEYGEVYHMASLQNLAQLNAFLSHCCHSCHYSISIKKCGEESCILFTDPMEIFRNIHHLPDPLPGEEGHYASFSDLYGTSSTEQHRSSLWRLLYSKHKLSTSDRRALQFALHLWCSVTGLGARGELFRRIC